MSLLKPVRIFLYISLHLCLTWRRCMSYGRAERGPLSRGGGLTHNNRAQLTMKSFHSEIYGSCRIDFQWKIKTPPCPTEKRINIKEFIGNLLWKEKYTDLSKICEITPSLYARSSVACKEKDFSQNFVFYASTFIHTYWVWTQRIWKTKPVYMCIMTQINKIIIFVKLLKNKSRRHSQSKSQLSHLLQKHKIASLFWKLRSFQ